MSAMNTCCALTLLSATNTNHATNNSPIYQHQAQQLNNTLPPLLTLVCTCAAVTSSWVRPRTESGTVTGAGPALLPMSVCTQPGWMASTVMPGCSSTASRKAHRPVKVSKKDLHCGALEWLKSNPESYLIDAVEGISRAIKTQAGRDAFTAELNQFRSKKVRFVQRK